MACCADKLSVSCAAYFTANHVHVLSRADEVSEDTETKRQVRQIMSAHMLPLSCAHDSQAVTNKAVATVAGPTPMGVTDDSIQAF